MRRRIRTLHRLMSPVFVLGVLVSLIVSGAGVSEDSPLFVGLGVVVITAIVTLLVTGAVMFVQHYWPRWQRQRGLRATQKSAA